MDVFLSLITYLLFNLLSRIVESPVTENAEIADALNISGPGSVCGSWMAAGIIFFRAPACRSCPRSPPPTSTIRILTPESESDLEAHVSL